MIKSITDALEQTCARFGQRNAYCSDRETTTYESFTADARRFGSALLRRGMEKKNLAVFIGKSVNCLRAMFGAAYANACYTVLDVTSPRERLNAILSTLQPACVIVDAASEKKLPADLGLPVLHAEELLAEEEEPERLARVRAARCDTDPLYVLFTSGSTGVPKGTVICHRSVLAYSRSVIETFGIDETTVWGSQTPLYFSMSVLDVFTSALSGASFVIIPRMCFSFPVMLMQYLNDKHINSIYWVPSAMGIVANFNTFDTLCPAWLTRVLFAGEVMPVKQLNVWRRALPEACFANLYGPTEITDTCTYFVVDRDFDETASLPIGVPFDNCDVLVVSEDGRQVLPGSGESGELCVRGSFLGLGYYNNPEKTAAVFTQNPLNHSYPERVYHTGDLVSYNERGELLYLGRRDFQIKHMGYRIELGEIEANISAVDGINECACVYENGQIVLFYQSLQVSEEIMLQEIKSRLVAYMRPTQVFRLRSMPHNANGKIDRKALAASLKAE